MGIEVSLSAVAYLLMVTEIMHAGPQVSSVTGRSCVHSSPGLSDSQEQNSPLRKNILSQINPKRKPFSIYQHSFIDIFLWIYLRKDCHHIYLGMYLSDPTSKLISPKTMQYIWSSKLSNKIWKISTHKSKL